MPKRKVRVLVVDDSMMFRETLKKMLNEDDGVDVVDTAVDAYDARDKLLKHEPDVMVLDVQMPRMDGIEFLKRLLPQYPIPVVVMSSLDNMVFDALRYGAVEFVNKPSSNVSLEDMVKELVIKIKIASIANVSSLKRINRKADTNGRASGTHVKVVAIGASTGGTEALYEVLQRLPGDLPPIVVVQHMPAVFTKMYAQRLNGLCKPVIKEAENAEELKAGAVYIAPGGLQMSIQRQQNKSMLRVFNGDKRNGHCPSCDVLFDSVAALYGKSAIGIILTGMGQDGAYGLLNMKQRGAVTLGQDEKSSVVYGMPKVAYEIGAVDYQLPIQEIGQKLLQLI
ncbi:MAG: two-component system, chemotaxis family, protein-glutamate methylesterase/glutaminase [Clostridiales bacterium]|jgi:two-component system chemotaxis response regulator CheB|nr:two-component system, chemotaxis family, protein-glutamate methylesterase/glutaminase [Clostridiales bacterium]MDN5297773.1 two-component system, chemotaxis family, protein-glutamate methylesterase/glutaminase [Clostridiales bacterium]